MLSNFNMNYENITMIKGDTLSFNVEVTDEDGERIEVDSAFFTCKKIATDSENIFQKRLNSGITQSDVLLTVRVSPEDTEDIEAGRYWYDLQLGIENDIYTVLIGILDIEQDVTERG